VKVVGARSAAAAAVSPRPDRAGTAIVHDHPATRLVAFRLQPGQVVTPHRNPGVVLLMVMEGRGVFSGESDERELAAGEVAIYEPNELHGMRALDGDLLVLATIIHRQEAPVALTARGER
jgi:quercetin dioxygenase-like cupin family protein